MDRITSFSVNHDTIAEGMYISRIDFDDIVTYDIRMKKPNNGDFLSPGESHTLEHLFATYARNSEWKDHVLYVGPMGCLTGMYLLTKGLSHENALKLTQQSMDFVCNFEGTIPGSKREECGNYALHDLPAAKATASHLVNALSQWSIEKMSYADFLD